MDYDLLYIIYLFNIFTCSTIGVLLLSTQKSPFLKDKIYSRAKMLLGVASIIIAIGNLFFMIKGTGYKSANILSFPIILISSLQAILFTFLIIILFRSQYVTLKNIIKHTIPTIVFIPLYIIAINIEPNYIARSIPEYIDNISNPSLIVRALFALTYFIQILIFIRIFRREKRIYINKLNNYFSDVSEYKFRWCRRLFSEALGIGVSMFLFCIYPSPVFDEIFTCAITIFYLIITIRYINYQNKLFYLQQAIDIKEELSNATSKVDTKKPEDTILEQKISEALDQNKFFLQQGVTINNVADALQISPRILSSYINSTYNQNFNLWINGLRIEHAKQIMPLPEYSNTSIEKIAKDCGFANATMFSRGFNKIEGTTPSKYFKIVKVTNK